MSAAGQIIAQVKEFVEGVLAKVHAHDEAQDKRLDALEARVSALEPAKSTTARAATAKTGTAAAAGKAHDAK